MVFNDSSAPEAHRLFFAAEIPESIRIRLYSLSKYWLQNVEKVKFVEPQNIHITIKFLGDVHLLLVNDIIHSTQKILKNFKPFVVKIGNPKLIKSRVACFEIWRGRYHLDTIFQELDESLNQFGIEREFRKYFPHVTTARLKTYVKALKIEKYNPTFRVDQISLIRSELTSDGPVYTNVKTFELKGE
ncbi:MAG: hypothetical protein APR63_13010 [Desulfuromonas sp. SDB]|nr:MAG: hypothetical protein APR63_13010 [Desulfuromonas sp. SDB]